MAHKPASFASLNVLVTNRCPLECPHCGPESGPTAVTDAVNVDGLRSALAIAKERDCRVVSFSGGDPFVLGARLGAMIELATKAGFVTRVATSAYWSRTDKRAREKLRPLVDAGLDQLLISSSDSHLAFVPIENVIVASRTAMALGLEVYLNLAVSKNSKLNYHTLCQVFERAGVAIPYFFVSPVIPFGRADRNFSADELLVQDVQNFAGPCPSFTEKVTIHGDGRVTGCAVVFGAQCEPLCFGNIKQTSFSDIMTTMDDNLLAAWIHKVGVVELKYFIEANTDIRFDDKYVNICHLCGDILSNPDALAFLQKAGFIQGPQCGPP